MEEPGYKARTEGAKIRRDSPVNLNKNDKATVVVTSNDPPLANAKDKLASKHKVAQSGGDFNGDCGRRQRECELPGQILA